MRTLPSAHAVATLLLSGENSIERTGPPCPASTSTNWWVRSRTTGVRRGVGLHLRQNHPMAVRRKLIQVRGVTELGERDAPTSSGNGIPHIEIAVLIQRKVANAGEVARRKETATHANLAYLAGQSVTGDIPLEGEFQGSCSLMVARFSHTTHKHEKACRRNKAGGLDHEVRNIREPRTQYLSDTPV